MAKKVTLKEKDLTQKTVKECFDYHEYGYLIWKYRPDYHFARTNGIKDRVFEDCIKRILSFYKVKLPELLVGTFNWVVNRNRKGIKYYE